MNIQQTIEAAAGQPAIDILSLSGGCVGQVYQVWFADGQTLVAKLDESPTPRLATEGFMLRYLAEKSELPVPAVVYESERLLLLEYLPGQSVFGRLAEQHAADLLAALHAQTAAAYGFERDTLIGGLVQPNGWLASWLDFFRERRLFYMGRAAEREGRLPTAVLHRLETLCSRLDQWLDEPERPSLIHGDVWTTNLLAENGRIIGFIDPAIYYAHPEIELAFTTLFGTFDHAFFARYDEKRPIAPDFFTVRRDIYNLYPLLVHLRLFGANYLPAITQTLQRFGC